jgi:hypothetical protein
VVAAFCYNTPARQHIGVAQIIQQLGLLEHLVGWGALATCAMGRLAWWTGAIVHCGGQQCIPYRRQQGITQNMHSGDWRKQTQQLPLQLPPVQLHTFDCAEEALVLQLVRLSTSLVHPNDMTR